MNKKGKSKSIKGSVLMPHYAGLRFVLNFASMNGDADGGLYNVFAKKWSKVREAVKGWYASKDGKYKLGAVNHTAVQSDLWVVHLLVKGEDGSIKDEVVEHALKEVAKQADYEHASVHISELLVQEFPNLKKLAETQLIDKGIDVSYYDES